MTGPNRERMFKGLIVTLAAWAFLQGSLAGEAQPNRASVRIAVTGESNLRSNFIESLKDAARDEKLSIDVVLRSDPDLTYTVIIAQETTIGSAAAAAIALD